MHSNIIDAEYYSGRLQTSLDMASHSINIGAMMAHQGLASCYRAKLASLNAVEAPRPVLSLASFRHKRQVSDSRSDRSISSVGASAAA
jgi:hypothetical protein